MKDSPLKKFIKSLFSHDPEDQGYFTRSFVKKEPKEYPHEIPEGIEDWMWKYLKDTNVIVNDKKRSYTFWDGTKIEHHVFRPFYVKDGDKIFYTPSKIDLNDGYTEITILPIPEFETKHKLSKWHDTHTYSIKIPGGWFFEYFGKIQAKVRAGRLKGNDQSVYEKIKVKPRYTRAFYEKAGLSKEDIDKIEYYFWDIYALDVKKVLDVLNVYPELYDADKDDWWVKHTAIYKYPEKTYRCLSSVMREDQITDCAAAGSERFREGFRYENKTFMDLCLKHSLYNTVTHAEECLTEELLDFFIDKDADNAICKAADLMNESQKDLCIQKCPKRSVERFKTLTEEQLAYCVRVLPDTTLSWEKYKPWSLTEKQREYCVNECPATVIDNRDNFSAEQLKLCIFLAPEAAMERGHAEDIRNLIDNEDFIHHCVDKCPASLLKYSHKFSKTTHEHLTACRANINSKGD